MTRAAQSREARGYFGIGIYQPKRETNVGTLWRTAYSFGAAFLFTVGSRYHRQSSDTTCAPRHVPLIEYADLDDLVEHLPHGCPLVGVELDEAAIGLARYCHRPQACYLLGAEDYGLPPAVRERCHELLCVDGAAYCLNVAVAGGIVLADRVAKAEKRRAA